MPCQRQQAFWDTSSAMALSANDLAHIRRDMDLFIAVKERATSEMTVLNQTEARGIDNTLKTTKVFMRYAISGQHLHLLDLPTEIRAIIFTKVTAGITAKFGSTYTISASEGGNLSLRLVNKMCRTEFEDAVYRTATFDARYFYAKHFAKLPVIRAAFRIRNLEISRSGLAAFVDNNRQEHVIATCFKELRRLTLVHRVRIDHAWVTKSKRVETKINNCVDKMFLYTSRNARADVCKFLALPGLKTIVEVEFVNHDQVVSFPIH